LVHAVLYYGIMWIGEVEQAHLREIRHSKSHSEFLW